MKIEGHPQGTRQGRKAAPPRVANRRSQYWKRAQIVVEFRGGPECSYVITFQGRHWRYPGHMDLHDVMTDCARRWW